MGKISDYIASKDQLGGPVGLTYRGNDSHQTACGGCASLIAGIIVWAFVGIQLFGLITEPGFTPIVTKTYQKVNVLSPET
jgi:hypothetical protein